MCLLWVWRWPFYTSICWWSNKHQWWFSHRPCHWKMLFPEKYHMSTSLILHFKFICCHKWLHTEEMIITCLMKSFDVSRHMPPIITWITRHCKYCQESNLYSCSQNTISWIFTSQHYIQCPLHMDLLPLFLYLMSKPFWLHFLMIAWECARRTLHPIMISLQERQNCQHQLLM